MTAREMSKYLRNYLTAKGLTLSIAKSTIGLPNPQLGCQIHNEKRISAFGTKGFVTP